MANPVPNALSLNVIQNGTLGDATPVESNFAAIQTAVNQLRACLANGTSGQLLSAVDGTDVQWVNNIAYRKTTAKQVVNTVAETDLLNGEITVGAGVLGTNGVLRLTAWGDLVNNSGGTINLPRLKLKLGGTTLLDTSTFLNMAASASRFGWRVSGEIFNLGATNSQWANLLVHIGMGLSGTNATSFATGEGLYTGVLLGSVGDVRAEGGNAGAVDTTVAQALALTVINGAAAATVDVTLKGAVAVVE